MSRRKATGPRPPTSLRPVPVGRVGALTFPEFLVRSWEERGWVVRVDGVRQFAEGFVEAWRRHAEEEGKG